MNSFNMKEKEIIDKILAAMDNLDKATLKNTLAYLIKIYVIDKKTINPGAKAGITPRPGDSTQPANFTELMIELKRNYPLPELDQFSIEGGNVYFVIGNKRYQVSANTESGISSSPLNQQIDDKQVTKSHNLGTDNATSRFGNLEMED